MIEVFISFILKLSFVVTTKKIPIEDTQMKNRKMSKHVNMYINKK